MDPSWLIQAPYLLAPESETTRGDPLIDRRTFLAATGAVLLAAPVAVEAQPERKVPKIGVLKIFTPVSSTWPPSSFWDRIRELGWVEGQNLAVERREAAGNWQRLPTLAGELMRLKVDVIVMDAGNAAKRVQESTRPTPICVTGGDLQASGVVKNLARPEGNITGVQLVQPDLVGKRLSLLKEAVPGLTRVGVLTEGRTGPLQVDVLRAAEDACRALALELHVVEVLESAALEPAFSTLKKVGARGALVLNNPSLTNRRDQIVALAAKSHVALIYEYRYWPDAGGLMSYGPITAEIYRQLAECVDKVLRGAKPADLPVQQPTKFELVINLKTAKALGLSIPPSLLERADEVIE